jgi:hypothetical protein
VARASVAGPVDEWTPIAMQALRVKAQPNRLLLPWIHPQHSADFDRKVLSELGRWRDSTGVVRVSLRSPGSTSLYSFNSLGAPLPLSVGAGPQAASGGSAARAQLSGTLTGPEAAYRHAVASGAIAPSAIAQRVLAYLLVERKDDLAPAFPDLPGIQLLPALRPFLKVPVTLFEMC